MPLTCSSSRFPLSETLAETAITLHQLCSLPESSSLSLVFVLDWVPIWGWQLQGDPSHLYFQCPEHCWRKSQTSEWRVFLKPKGDLLCSLAACGCRPTAFQTFPTLPPLHTSCTVFQLIDKRWPVCFKWSCCPSTNCSKIHLCLSPFLTIQLQF